MSWQVTSGKIPTGRGIGQVGFADAAETGSGSVVRATSPTTTNQIVGTQAPGDNTTKAASTAFVTSAIAAAGITGFPLQGYINGLTLSTAGGSATMGIAAGLATDSTAASAMTLASAYTKTASAWAVGSGNGGLDTGAIAANTWYHWWLVQRSDTGVVDVLFSLSPTAPTMPANYDRKRYLGPARANGSSQWIKFLQLGNYFLWDVPTYTVVVAMTVAATLYTTAASIPTGVVVEVDLRADFSDSAPTHYALLTSPSQTDSAPTSNLFTAYIIAAQPIPIVPVTLRTDTSGQFRGRASATSVGFDYTVIGFRVPL